MATRQPSAEGQAGVQSAVPPEEPAMNPALDRDALRDRFAEMLLATARLLQTGADPEVTLEALIEAAGVVRERLQQELTELRVEQVG